MLKIVRNAKNQNRTQSFIPIVLLNIGRKWLKKDEKMGFIS